MVDIVVLAAAGAGTANREFAEPLFSALKVALGDDWSRLYCDTLPALESLTGNVDRVFQSMCKGEMDYLRARKFLLSGIALGAAQLGDLQQRDGAYERVQGAIYRVLQKAAVEAGERTPVVLLSHSLGCINLSNYLWDAQRSSVSHGIWRDGGPGGVRKGSARERFLRLKTLSYWYTLGANNPLWCAGRAREQIQAVTADSRGYRFRWKNFYHPDDLFGWPLKPLSPTYNHAVFKDYETRPLDDHQVNVSGPQVLPPEDYWSNGMVLEQLLEDLHALLKNGHQGGSAPVQRSQRTLAV
ncbi:hypothetical protein [Microbulbifer sp. GL-2]|uniref:hypothetical protein n=1 Tax=Microbulbifer sp. GL-2 TaxID=2591606 RepID=UPI001163BBC8|nr:hypothetical protein [Microbulbifer sp. GL-2]BBM01769.1 hypothetical protein GL2_18430 [Microbulbifer sp. GL-2]